MSFTRLAVSSTVSAALLAGAAVVPAHAADADIACISSFGAQAHTVGTGAGIRIYAQAGYLPTAEAFDLRWRPVGSTLWVPAGPVPAVGTHRMGEKVIDGLAAGQRVEVDVNCLTPTGDTGWQGERPGFTTQKVTALAASSAPRLRVMPFEGGLLASIDAPTDMGGAAIVTGYHLTWWRNGYKVGERFLDVTDTDAVSFDGPSAAGDPNVDHFIDGLTFGTTYTVKVAATLIAAPMPTTDPTWRYAIEGTPGWTKQSTASAVPLIPTVLLVNAPSTVKSYSRTRVTADLAKRNGAAFKGQKVTFTFDPDGKAKARKVASGTTNRKGVVTKRLRFTKSGVLKVSYKGTSKYHGRTQTIRVTVKGR
jgi:hypothetical protein